MTSVKWLQTTEQMFQGGDTNSVIANTPEYTYSNLGITNIVLPPDISIFLSTTIILKELLTIICS